MPTGITCLMTQTTSGIEPVFMSVYKRRRKITPTYKNVRVNFVNDVGDSWEEYVVFHHHFKQRMEVNSIDFCKHLSDTAVNKLINK